MLKKKITFQISQLSSLLESGNSCVTVVKNFKGALTLFPFHLGYLKHAVKELLDNKVSKYDPELNGIILGHSNIKVINYLQHLDGFKINLTYIADIYLFTPAVGKNLTGIINKKSKEHIGCLIHTAFNASIPKPRDEGEDLSIWFRTHGSVQIGNELDFTVSKVDFSSRVPYISGVIVRKDFHYKEEEFDSGVCCQEPVDDSVKVKKKKRKSKESYSVVDDSQNNDINYHDPDTINELLGSNTQEAHKKKKSNKSSKIHNSELFSPPSCKKIKKEVHNDEIEECFPLPIQSPKIKKERLSCSPSPDRSLLLKKKSKSKKNSLDQNDSFDLNKIKSEPSVDELTSSLLQKAMDNCYSPNYNGALESDKKKKHKTRDPEKVDLDLNNSASKNTGKLPLLEKETEVKQEIDFESLDKKSRKRKRSESAAMSESDDSFHKKAKRKKSRKSKDGLEELTNSILADTMAQL